MLLIEVIRCFITNTQLYNNMSQYFKISIIDNTYGIQQGPMILPLVFESISNFNSLEQNDPSSLTGLAWAGMPEIGFWSGVYSEKPSYDYTENLIETYDLVPQSGAVSVNYEVKKLPDMQISGKVGSWQAQIKETRDEYLQLTDFTQLADVPISAEFKEEYRVFREQLRDMFNDVGPTGTGLVWPDMPTGVPNVNLPPLPPFPPLV